MNKKQLTGSWTALVTPFDEKGAVDYDALDRLVDMHIQAKTDGILLCGTTGEAATLDYEEKKSILSAVKQRAKGQCQIMFGTGSNNTKECVNLTEKITQLQAADCLLVVTPYYNKPGQNGLIEHYKAVAAATDLDIILYNVPGRTGCNMQHETVTTLSQIGNIIGVKEASGDLVQTMNIIKDTPDNFIVYSGEDALNFPIMACGGKGTISVTANVLPAELKAFNDAAVAGQIDKAREIHFSLLKMHAAMFVETNPLPAKAALTIMGKIQDYARLPLTRPQASTYKFLERIIG